jgi:hypothetical protein
MVLTQYFFYVLFFGVCREDDAKGWQKAEQSLTSLAY